MRSSLNTHERNVFLGVRILDCLPSNNLAVCISIADWKDNIVVVVSFGSKKKGEWVEETKVEGEFETKPKKGREGVGRRPNCQKRDQDFLYLFVRLLPEDQREDFAVYPSRSTPTRIPVSFSQSGARKWNAKHRQDWVKYNDFFENVVVPEDYLNPVVCLFTNKYRVLNEQSPGSAEEPNMIEKTLDFDMPIALDIGHIISYCEKVKHVSLIGTDGVKTSSPVDPYELGCRFDYRSGTCLYTLEYCTRLGLEFSTEDSKSTSNCWRNPMMEITSFLTSETIARSSFSLLTSAVNLFSGPQKIVFKDANTTKRTPRYGMCGVGEACTKDEHCIPPARCLTNEYGQKACR